MKTVYLIFFKLLFCTVLLNQSLSAQTITEILENSNAQISDKQYDVAIDYLTSIIAKQPENDVAYSQRARAYFSKTNSDDLALSDSEKALSINKNNVNALNIRGNVNVNLGRNDAALSDFEQAIKIDPNFSKPYFNRSLIYLNRKEFDKAISDYSKVLAIDPKNENAYLYRSHAYFEKSDTNNALSDINKAIEINKNNSSAIIFRGKLNVMKGYYDQAFADFKSISKEDREYDNAQKGLVFAKEWYEKDNASINSFAKSQDRNADRPVNSENTQAKEEQTIARNRNTKSNSSETTPAFSQQNKDNEQHQKNMDAIQRSRERDLNRSYKEKNR